jgi:hypothetical protein
MGRKSNDNINHDAHLYGALFGLLFLRGTLSVINSTVHRTNFELALF